MSGTVRLALTPVGSTTGSLRASLRPSHPAVSTSCSHDAARSVRTRPSVRPDESARVAYRDRVRDATGIVDQVQQEGGALVEVAHRRAGAQRQGALPEGARSGDDRRPGEPGGDGPVYVPGEHPDDLRVAADDPGES